MICDHIQNNQKYRHEEMANLFPLSSDNPRRTEALIKSARNLINVLPNITLSFNGTQTYNIDLYPSNFQQVNSLLFILVKV